MARTGPLSSATLRRVLVVGLVLAGALLLFIGLGSALDALVAQSHPIDPATALLLRAEYTLAGAILLGYGVWLARSGSDS